MTTMFVRHTVSDYNKWKQVYDGLASLRKENGVTGASVYRESNNPNRITVSHQFSDINAATAFANSEDLKSGMAKGGVQGHPEIWFTNSIETTPY